MPVQNYFSPLLVIGIFITFTEVIAGYAVSKSQGSIQKILTIFAVTFPVTIALIFFCFLWFKPGNLYAPKDYTSDESFLAVQNIEKESSQNLRKAFQELTARLSSEQKDNNIITIDFEKFDNTSKKLVFPITMFSTFQDLLNELYFSINGKNKIVNPFSYGAEWQLVDKSSGTVFKHLKQSTNIQNETFITDNRSLTEVGIKSGIEMDLIKLNK